MRWFTEAFEPELMQRALLAGMLTVLVCSVVGTWVVLRRLTFMGDALAHGVLPGIAVAYLVGFNVVVGAAIGAVVMVAGVTLVTRNDRLPEDTGIGLLFVGMLALGVMIVSKAGSFAGDLTGFLFGDVLGVTTGDLRLLAVSAAVTLLLSALGYRPFLALAFDERKAATLGLRPGLARMLLLGLVALAVVSSFRAVGTLLVFALIVAPPATAALVTRHVVGMMVTSVFLGWIAVVGGLLASWHWGLAGEAAMAAFAVLQFFVVFAIVEMGTGIARRRAARPA